LPITGSAAATVTAAPANARVNVFPIMATPFADAGRDAVHRCLGTSEYVCRTTPRGLERLSDELGFFRWDFLATVCSELT
jgi:hypothetical protein